MISWTKATPHPLMFPLTREKSIRKRAAAKEREYERETSGRLAKKSPAGISVATADSVDVTSSPTTSSGGSEEL